MDLGTKSSFTLPKDMLSKVPKLKKEKHIALLNLTRDYHYVLLRGLHDGDKITEIRDASVSKLRFPIRIPHSHSNVLDAQFYLPNGTLVNDPNPRPPGGGDSSEESEEQPKFTKTTVTKKKTVKKKTKEVKKSSRGLSPDLVSPRGGRESLLDKMMEKERKDELH